MSVNNHALHPLWFTTYGSPQLGRARIFAFPYSGAGTMVYYNWADHFRDSTIDLLGVQLPGRETRLKETPISNLSLLLKKLLPAIMPLLDKPFVFFGHSLGALVAFELSRALHRHGLPLPRHLFVSAFRSPELPNPNKELHQLADLDFIAGITEYGETPEEVLKNRELMALFLPMLRADFSMQENYRYQEEIPLSCPITALAGTKDEFLKPEHMFNWQCQTKAGFKLVQYAGNHFFLHEHKAAIIREMQISLSV